MKKVFKSQRGYALILVLLTIVLIGIMIPPLVGSVLSSAKQNNITEENNQMTKITEMGMIYFRNYIENIETEQQNKLESELKDKVIEVKNRYKDSELTDEQLEREIIKAKIQYKIAFITQLFNEFNVKYIDSENLEIQLIGNKDYQFSIKDITKDIEKLIKDPPTSVVDADNYYINVSYKSIASNSSHTFKTWDQEEPLRIRFGNIDNSDGGNDDSDNNNDDDTTNPVITFPNKPKNCTELNLGRVSTGTYNSTCVTNNLIIGADNQSETVTINGELYVGGNLDITGHNQNSYSKLTINGGNLIVKGTMDPKFAEIEVHGNAYFQNIINSTNAHITIDVYGDAYVFGTISEAVTINVHNGTLYPNN